MQKKITLTLLLIALVIAFALPGAAQASTIAPAGGTPHADGRLVWSGWDHPGFDGLAPWNAGSGESSFTTGGPFWPDGQPLY